ncbi:putative cytochrome P450 126 [Frankia canadensis]|uniref:Putative cytochrome P450 126 n=1 Tax=Frankia canadensis TaxID=1836972 RepID=A0A2I2KKZ0_9ACTN|nr:cytochrome P450 [Frankia canadensis]SNQ46323.1 putative cytochrome P450 126 [Frankia canadensis]SOU53613.1 putative cytochrome P450 126 [Frankia canadensis]
MSTTEPVSRPGGETVTAAAVDAPPGLPPVLGGVDLTDSAGFADGIPYDVLARLRAQAPILFHPPGISVDGEGFWVLTRHADIAAAAADPVFSSQGGGGRSGGGTHLDDLPVGVHAGVLIGMTDDPRHALVRDLLEPSFDRYAAAALEPELRRLAARRVRAALERGSGNFAADVAGPYATDAVALLLGAPRTDWPTLTGWTDAVAGLVNRRTGAVDDESRAIGLGIAEYCGGLLAARRAQPVAGVASVLATAELAEHAEEPPLSDHDRVANLNLLFLTGVEQPRNTAASGVLALAEHPDQWRALRADRSLLPTAIEEILRWAPPNPYNRRTARTDVDVRGVRIRAGQKVTLWWASANRDEDVFPDAGRFDIRRNPNPHLSFGAGPHACLADDLARLELRVLLEELLDRVEELRLTGPVAWTPSNKHAVVVDLPLELVPAAGRSRPAATDGHGRKERDGDEH